MKKLFFIIIVIFIISVTVLLFLHLYGEYKENIQKENISQNKEVIEEEHEPTIEEKVQQDI